MTLIGNNCVSASIYRALNMLFNMPFCWCCIDTTDFIKFVQNYDNINLENISICTEKYKDDWKSTSILITLNDYNIRVHFIHHVYDENFDFPKDDGMSVHYKDILQWSKDKWYDRLQRMEEHPTFVFSFNTISSDAENYKEIFKKLVSITNLNLIIIMHDIIDVSDIDIPNNIKIITLSDEIMKQHVFRIGNELKDKFE